jgi:hypothetical protein
LHSQHHSQRHSQRQQNGCRDNTSRMMGHDSWRKSLRRQDHMLEVESNKSLSKVEQVMLRLDQGNEERESWWDEERELSSCGQDTESAASCAHETDTAGGLHLANGQASATNRPRNRDVLEEACMNGGVVEEASQWLVEEEPCQLLVQPNRAGLAMRDNTSVTGGGLAIAEKTTLTETPLKATLTQTARTEIAAVTETAVRENGAETHSVTDNARKTENGTQYPRLHAPLLNDWREMEELRGQVCGNLALSLLKLGNPEEALRITSQVPPLSRARLMASYLVSLCRAH